MSNIIINESRSGDISNIIKSSTHIYSHLMKFISIKPKLTSWVSTIYEQSGQLNNITKVSYWREVTNNKSKLLKIRNDAIAKYSKDGNSNGEIYFNIVYNDFYDIDKFKDKDLLKSYLLNHCDSDEKDMYEYIENFFNKQKL